ncbi:hypothetical protein FRC09_009772 [Ceratobasidium sp. 395]|nr:hypothetical protein FRC09_009772 [Ceratobasidium sp. 395]
MSCSRPHSRAIGSASLRLSPSSSINPPAAARVYRVPELWGMVCCLLDSSSYRTLALTCTSNAYDFTPLVWRHLTDLGNLLSVLHDTLRVDPEGPGDFVVPPDHWVDWTYLDRLIPLVGSAKDGRTALMPCVEEALLSVDGWNRRPFAPYVRLFANSSLHTLVVQRESDRVYTPLSAPDAEEVLRLASEGINPGNQRSCHLGIYPDDGYHATATLAQLLPRPFTSLTNLSVSAWMLSKDAFLAFAGYPLVRLSVHGRLNARAANLEELHELEIPEGSFQDLRQVVLANLRFDDTVNIMRTPRLMDAVSSLKLDMALIPFLGFQDEDEDAAYMTIIDEVVKVTSLKSLVIVSARNNTEPPYSMTPLMVEKLCVLHLAHLCLYNFAVEESVGFHTVRENAVGNWENITQLSMLSQDLLPDDLVAFSCLPRLWRLAANVSPALGKEFREAIGPGFSRRLHLVSRFRFGIAFRRFDDRKPPEHCRALYRMIT